ncbi:acyltransferase family protein [Streptomyces sp. NPDC057376]|uniref:acyltransferase family protein n=1 Tax=unclassified Streptomyces TaxID=2593676 RepID=UPI00093D3CD0|nr:acyltransferase [Streptomyces sp. CB02414]
MPTRLASLTSLRFFAAFAVFVHHFNGVGPGGGVWQVPDLFPYSKIGAHGVTFFFVLSGFLLTWSHKPGNGKKVFYWRRFGRIYPAHLVAAVAAVAVFYGMGDDRTDAVSFVASLLLVQAWLPDAVPTLPGNPVTWTLSVELLFYALFPLVIGRLRALRTRSLAVLTLAGLAGMWAVHMAADHYLNGHDASWVMRHPVVYLPQFLIGVTFAIALRRGHRVPVRPTAVVLVFFVYAVVYTRASDWASPFVAHQMEGTVRPVVAILSVLLIAACVQNEGAGRSRLLTNRSLIALGASSYAFYLVHQTVNQFIREYWPHRMEPNNEAIVFLLGTFLISQALAWLLYRWVEEPAQKWWTRRGPKSRPAGVPTSPAATVVQGKP